MDFETGKNPPEETIEFAGGRLTGHQDTRTPGFDFNPALCPGGLMVED
jgi:hypothetical protein